MATKAAQVESALAGYIDASNRPLENGKIYTYEAGTTTPKATYADVDKSQALPNPIILDGNGKKMIYADGLYKFVIKDKDDNLIDTRDNLQYFYLSGSITVASTIIASDSSGISIQDDGGNTGITVKDGGNVGIKGDTNPQSAFGIADSSNAAYASTLSVSTSAYDVVRIRNIHATGDFVALTMEVGASNVGMSRLITKKDSSDETSFYIQLKDSLSSTFTTQQLALTSEGDLTIGNSINVGNLSLSGNTLSSISGDLNIVPFAGQDVVIDSHFEFDGNLLTALTDNNTVITAYVGKNITIEDVTFDGGVVAGIGTLTATTANITTANITTGNIATIAGVTTLTVATANITTGNIATANITTGNITTIAGVTTLTATTANITTGNITTIAGVTTLTATTANITTGNIATANITTGNITTIAGVTTLTATTANITTGNITTAAISGGTATLTSAGITTLTIGSNVYTSGSISGSLNFDSGTFFIDSSTNMVGVGTTSPTTVLQVSGGGTPASFTTGTVASFLRGASSGNDSYIAIQSGNAGVAGINLGATAADALATLKYNNTGNTLSLLNSLYGFTLNSSGKMVIGTYANGTTLGIRAPGNTSIGLTVNNANAVSYLLDTRDVGQGYGPRLAFAITYNSGANTIGAGAISTYMENIPNNSGGDYAHSLVFETASYTTGLREVGRFTSSGNMGIGTTSVSSLGTNIITLGIRGLSAARSGGTYLENSDSSIKFAMYGATDESASNPFAFGTLTNHGFRFLANNSVVAQVTSGGDFGFGASTVSARIHAISITEQFRIGYDSSNYWSSVVNDTGSITWSLTGTTPTFNLSNRVVITPAAVSGVQEALRLVDSGSGATEGSYIRWDNSDRTDMARIGGSSEGTGGGLGFWVNSANSGTPTQAAYLSAAGNFGFGTTTVSARGHFVSTTEQIRFGYDLSNYGSISSSSSGVISIGGSLGIVSIPNQPAVRAYKSSAQSLTSGSSGAVVTMDSEDFDVGGLHSTSSNTERITAVIDGNYMFNVTVEFGNGNTGSGKYFLIYLRKNGTVIRGAYAKSAPTPDTETILNISSVIPLVAGDYVDCVAVQTTGTSVNIGPTSGTTAIEAIKVS